MGTGSKYYLEVIGKLEKYCKKKYLAVIIIGIQFILMITLVLITMFSLLELAANFNSLARTVLFYIGAAIVGGLTVYLLLIPFLQYFKVLRKESYQEVAENVGKHFPDVKDELLNSMQLVSSEKNEKLYSKGLIDGAFQNIYNRIKNLKFEKAINFDKVKNNSFYLGGTTIVFLLMFLFLPGMKAASYRVINYNKEFIKPPAFRFIINPGDAEITKGEDIAVTASVEGKAPHEIYFAVKYIDETEYKLQRSTPDSLGRFNLNFSSVRSSFKYFASSGNIKSDEFEIKVVDRPIVKTLQLEIVPPSYSRLEKIVQKDNGNVSALKGTKVNIDISSTKSLNKAYLEFDDSTSTSLAVSGNEASGKFIIASDNQYRIKLVDEIGNENPSPITYQVKSLYDEYPNIEMIAPNKNILLSNDNRVNIISNIKDDYGFTKLSLNYRLSESRYETPQQDFRQIKIQLQPGEKEILVNYIWNLSLLSLGADDVVSYYLEVFDNDNVSGPKSAKTSVFSIRVPSLDEILADVDQTQTNVQNELQQTLKEAKDLQKSLEEIDQELKKDQEKLTWEEKQKIENALDKYENMQNKVDELSKHIQEMQNNLQQNNLLSKETMEKYMELQKLMDELTDEEMKKALEQLRNTLEQLNRQMTQEQMENFKFDEERFKKSLERTLNLLKRIQIEQKVDELMKRAEDLTSEQNEIKEQTEKSNTSNQDKKNELAQKQKDLTEKLNRLEEEMKSLNEKMSEIDKMPQEELEKIIKEFKAQQNQKMSQQASRDIQKNNLQSTMQQQQQISGNMNKLSQQMQDMKNSMMMQNQLQTFTDMMKLLDNMLELSKRQEDLKNETRNSDPNSDMFNKNAEEQENLRRDLANIMSQMSKLSQKTFAITPQMGKALGVANKSMQQSVQSLQNRNGSLAAMSQEEGMMHLNEAGLMLKRTMESMMQGGNGGGGMMSLMQQLQQLSSQQMNLNTLTQMLQQMQQGQLSPQQQGELQKLAQQQDVIRKSLAQLNEEAKISGEVSKIPADLENILNEMQEVLTDMNTEKLDDNLIQKQEHVLSKLLDAQRSINERDFEKERKSNTGKNIAGESPQDINLSSDEGKERLKDELNDAVKEGYAKDFEDLILKYYEAIRKEGIVK